MARTTPCLPPQPFLFWTKSHARKEPSSPQCNEHHSKESLLLILLSLSLLGLPDKSTLSLAAAGPAPTQIDDYADRPSFPPFSLEGECDVESCGMQCKAEARVSELGGPGRAEGSLAKSAGRQHSDSERAGDRRRRRRKQGNC
jgi:hypothetical protein